MPRFGVFSVAGEPHSLSNCFTETEGALTVEPVR